MKLCSLTLAIVVAASGAWAATPTEVLRQTAAVAKQEVLVLKSQQLALRNELSTVSSRANELKAQNSGLLAGGQLDRTLKRSQELSATLTSLAQQVSVKENELEIANVALLDSVSTEMAKLRADFDRASDRSVRAKVMSSLKQLRAERDALRAALPVGRTPTLEALKPSDDLDEIREQLDLARDTEEKVRRELKVVEVRLAERAEERRLDRQMNSFLGEESLFDDQDRRLRIERQETKVSSVQTPPAALGETRGPMSADSTTVRDFAGAPAAPGAPGPSLGLSGDGRGSPSPMSAPEPAPSNTITRVTQGADARVQVGGQPQGLAGGDEKDLDELELQRARLKSLAEQLKSRAKALEAKAASFK